MAGAREHPDRQKLEDAVQQMIPKLTRKWCPGAFPLGMPCHKQALTSAIEGPIHCPSIQLCIIDTMALPN